MEGRGQSMLSRAALRIINRARHSNAGCSTAWARNDVTRRFHRYGRKSAQATNPDQEQPLECLQRGHQGASEHLVNPPLECELRLPRTSRTFCSSPSKTIEKSSNFSGSPIGILAVREMTDARKHGEIEICECIGEPVGPCIRE